METSMLIIIGLILVAALYYVKYLYVEKFDSSTIQVVNIGQPSTLDTGSNAQFETIQKQAMVRKEKIQGAVQLINPVYDKLKNSMNDILKQIKEGQDSAEKDAKLYIIINSLLSSNVFKDMQPYEFEKAYPNFVPEVKKLSAHNKGGVKVMILDMIHFLNYLNNAIDQ